MRVLILGCNQLTTSLVPDLVQAGSRVTVMAEARQSLERMADELGVEVILTAEPRMQDYLRQGGIDSTEAFLALSGNGHLNALAAQIAHHIFNVPKVVCHLDDPQLQIFYAGLGLNVVGYSFGLLQDIRQAIER